MTSPIAYQSNGIGADWDSWGKPVTDAANQYLLGTGPRDPLFKRKTADSTPQNNTTAFKNDEDLFLNLAANVVYEFYLPLWYSTNATADLKIAWSLPTGCTMRYSALCVAASGGAWQLFRLIETDPLAVDGSVGIVEMKGSIIVGGTAGAAQLQWGQNVAAVVNTFAQAGSFFRAMPVG